MLIYQSGDAKQLSIDDQIPADKISAIYLDSQNRVWLGTDASGVFRSRAEEKWSRFSSNVGLAGNPITAILEDSRKNIWIGSTPPMDKKSRTFKLSGLHLFNKQGWFHFNATNGLLFNGAQALALNSSDALLVSTRRGISQIDTQGMITNYGQSQGISPAYAHSAATDSKGRIWFAHQFYGDTISWIDSENVYSIAKGKGVLERHIIAIGFDAEKRVWLIGSNGAAGIYPMRYLESIADSKPLNLKAIRPVSMFDRR